MAKDSSPSHSASHFHKQGSNNRIVTGLEDCHY